MKKKILTSVLIAFFALLSAFTLIACSASGRADNSAPVYSESGGDALPPQDAEVPGDDTGTESSTVVRKVIFTADVTYEVADVAEAVKLLRSKLDKTDMGEYVASSKEADDYASLTVKVRSERLDEFFEGLNEAGKRTSYGLSSEDISTTYYNIQSLIDSAETELALLEQYKANAKNQEEMNSIIAQIAVVRTRLELYQKQGSALDAKADYATVYVYFNKAYEEAPTPEFGTRAGNVFSGAWKALGKFFQVLAIVIIAVFPFALVFVPVGVGVFFLVKFIKKRKKAKLETETAEKEKE
ncbi:MAG: DUF4349 domain-containing protein [Christensenellaceae bacterium]|jgi:tetratricopeptide (TPR) repeat protein|nr:DUF4349 domain-containing protein [Christensenellaceae bacterium]